MSSVAELQALNYRQLQTECKKHGIPAKGKSEELLGKLILNLQKTNPGAASPAPTPQPAKKTSGRAPPAAAATPSAPSPSPRKSVDKKTVQRALSTPLPASPARPRTARTPAAAPAPHPLPGALASTMAAILAVLIAVMLYYPMIQHYCTQTDCTGRFATAALQLFERVHVVGTAAAEQARWATRQASSKLQDLVNQVQGGDSGAPRAFDGRLNTAVLSSVLRTDAGGAWEELRLSLDEAWTGGKIAADRSKANVLLFACSSPSACSRAAGELAAAAPVDETLVLGPVDVAAGRGAVQARLAAHLSAHPRGVVVVPAVDRVPLATLPVLSNAMGEYGALTANGASVSTAGATFLLTWQAPAAVMAEDSETSFSLAAKRDLTLLLRGEAGDEAATAAVDAFRRRIDLVAPVADPHADEE